jgi:hypothetical protein
VGNTSLARMILGGVEHYYVRPYLIHQLVELELKYGD